MTIKKTALAVATTAALALSFSQNALADVYAGSSLDISNLVIMVPGNTGPGVTGFTFNLNNSAALNGAGAPPPTTGSCNSVGVPACNSSGVGPVLAAPAANAPGSSPMRVDGAPNNFAFFGPGSGLTFANADSQINTAQVVMGVPTNTQQIAEAELAGSGNAQAATVVQSNTTFIWTFAVVGGVGGGSLVMNFDADPDLFVAVATPGLQAAFAQANGSATFNLTGDNGTVIAWTPDGVFGNAFSSCVGGATCAETADSQNLNNTIPLVAGKPSNGFSDNRAVPGSDLGGTPFGINISGLTSGNYTLVLTATTSVSIAQRVPEPSILGLMGIGLLGMIGSARRRKTAA